MKSTFFVRLQSHETVLFARSKDHGDLKSDEKVLFMHEIYTVRKNHDCIFQVFWKKTKIHRKNLIYTLILCFFFWHAAQVWWKSPLHAWNVHSPKTLWFWSALPMQVSIFWTEFGVHFDSSGMSRFESSFLMSSRGYASIWPSQFCASVSSHWLGANKQSFSCDRKITGISSLTKKSSSCMKCAQSQNVMVLVRRPHAGVHFLDRIWDTFWLIRDVAIWIVFCDEFSRVRFDFGVSVLCFRVKPLIVCKLNGLF